MPQAGEVNEEENVEQQGDDHDYHYQHDYEQLQPEYEQHQEFNERPVQQLPLYHVPTYTYQHQKDLDSIETQLQNMIQDQKLLGKEILDVKKYQMSAVTMGSSGSSSSPQPPPPPYEPDQALMKIREQHANFTEITRQLRDWTRNASARESYSIWAHQQANPNLVEMSSQKIMKQIYDNIDHKSPMFRGLMKSDLQPSNPAPPPSSSKDPKDPPK
ncbi:hypothetical protein PIB30_087641 [Stylosanthes scabra]|uniref:Uncharacterized protein n=1 Tax=Stylosanthes scabra TaxID=79078 RepID=A0ABU6VSL0_9FABA|nr:hypothetical protein [Stylosanthes scabra]